MRTTMTNKIKKNNKTVNTAKGCCALLGMMMMMMMMICLLLSPNEVDAFSLIHHHHPSVVTVSSTSSWSRPTPPLLTAGVTNPLRRHHRHLGMLQATTIYDDDGDDNDDTTTTTTTSIKNPKKEPTAFMNPTPVVYSAISNLVDDQKSVTIPALATGAALLAMMLWFASPDLANAAMSGGRMGGSFSAPRSSSSSSMSRPIMPYSRGYNADGGYGYGGGYSRGGYSSPGITIAPIISPFASPLASPFYNPLAFPRPYYYGGGGPSVVAVSRGPSFLDLIFFGAIGLVIFNTIRGFTSSSSSMTTAGGDGFWSDSNTVATMSSSALGPGTTVAQISVALEVPNRDDSNSILNALQRLSKTANTDSRVGIQSLTSQVALELLRRKSSIVSAATRSKHFSSGSSSNSQAQREFNSRAIQERGKFEQETVSKFMGVDYGSSSSAAAASSSASALRRGGDDDGNSSKATMAVITLVIAIAGDSTVLPKINSIKDVEDALRKIASDVKVDDCLQSAEILWTPTDRTETLTRREVAADYPELRTV
jgi:uncharacterized membrane protein